ncbi:transmembrane protein [Streptomyces sp. AA4]|nr:transmembrane protein [Streptomyces sp. AA4]
MHAISLIGAFTFVWFGMVLAISFLEAPLKFRALGVTIPIGLGIGRIVFRALNIAEVLLAAGVAITVVIGRPGAAVTVLAAVAVVVLIGQLGAVRPALNRRTDRVLAAPEGVELPRSRAHFVYIATETVKVLVLLALGILTVAG